MELDARGRRLRAALAALMVKADEPELRMVHRWLDTWTGLGLVVVGVERHGLRFSLSHIADREWRAYFMASPMFAPEGFGVAPTPWGAVQRASWAAMGTSLDSRGIKHQGG